ncbi:hypothetical protein EVAR_85793_1 [Eumeta japonica]|uniref:Uncharacterized protein n=1 Tax=Eumeta variegata TaxID=151549 RepID=A0A4C1URZ0_EUMVA|nr:hypothetical protein EVAR_85793_1 [Eumeta japonica]
MTDAQTQQGGHARDVKQSLVSEIKQKTRAGAVPLDDRGSNAWTPEARRRKGEFPRKLTSSGLSRRVHFLMQTRQGLKESAPSYTMVKNGLTYFNKDERAVKMILAQDVL